MTSFLSLEPELLILHETVSDQDRYIHVTGVPTRVVHLYCLAILHLIYKVDIPLCGDFHSDVYFCTCKLIHKINSITTQPEFIPLFFKFLQFIGPWHCSYFLWAICFARRINVLASSVRVWIFHSTVAFLWWDPTLQFFIVCLESSIDDPKGGSENIPLSALYLWILTSNLAAHLSKADFPAKFFSCLVLLISCAQVRSLNGPSLLWQPKCVRLLFWLIIVVLSLADMTGVGLLIL